MRKLQTKDVFKAMRIVKAARLREQLEAINDLFKKEASQDEMGLEIISYFISSASDEKVEDLIYDFLGGIFEKDAEEVKSMELDDLYRNLKELGQVVGKEDWLAFLKSLASMMR